MLCTCGIIIYATNTIEANLLFKFQPFELKLELRLPLKVRPKRWEIKNKIEEQIQ